jgi:hypothetical protein
MKKGLIMEGMIRILNKNKMLKQIDKIQEEYKFKKFVFIKSETMYEILLFLGASEKDMNKLQFVSNNLNDDPTLPFRRSRNGRFCFDLDIQKLQRLEFQPFVLSKQEDFVRHDSGKLRKFDEIENELQLNSVFQALMFFQLLIFKDINIKKRPNLD